MEFEECAKMSGFCTAGHIYYVRSACMFSFVETKVYTITRSLRKYS